ncbi:MAG: hypothetical protein A2147_06585 [Chloroflexi bacterium RBG_16_57_8]|nr:MAG: hypothetical protein A2147_06585 [Chloroflexi bacterium RBG_16_57_8]
MSAVRTIDVKGLEHADKEKLIFPGLESLKDRETLRIVVEFNPTPLVYLLKAEGKFDIRYEKEGPDEWVLQVSRVPDREGQKQQFRELITGLRGDEASPELKEKARALLQDVDAKTLGVMEQELLNEGVSHDEIRKSLCDIHLEVMKDSLVAKRIDVSAPHPIHTFMAEHEVIVSTLERLGRLVGKIETAGSVEELGADLKELVDVAHHLVEAESHHQREEEALFPELEKQGITEPPQIMKMDHVEFRKHKRSLYQLALHPEEYDFGQFKSRVVELGQFLTKELNSHIFKEDNILYQIALQTLSEEDWVKVKRLCDQVGYCCFTPQDQQEVKKVNSTVVELDLRQIMPFERHELIFEKWEALPAGDTLRIINDHDPKPLRYQFEVEYKDHYEWEYEQQGPKDWKVSIKKK